MPKPPFTADPESPPTPVTFADIESAAERLKGVARRTPVETCASIDAVAGCQIFLKCENMQRTAAFKFRGAYNALSRLPEGCAGVVAYSSGNHAQAVALSSALLGVRAVIVMPSNAPKVKLAATRDRLAGAPEGSAVVTYDPETETREEVGGAIAEREGLTVVPPYDHPHVIAGQGTAGMELIQDAGPMDALFVCTGGGGLLSGCALSARALAPGCEVVGVEPAAADDATRSFQTRELQSVHNPDTIADGARTPYMGLYTFPLVLANVDRMMTVTDAELASAMRLVYERAKLVIEPTGALALAGVIKTAREDPESVRGKRIGVIISGGNVDLEGLPRFFALADG